VCVVLSDDYANISQVGVQLTASADNVALLTFATAERRAAVDQYLLLAGPTAVNPQQRQSAADKRDSQTDRRTPCCYIDLAPHTKKVKVTRLPSVGFRSWSRFLAVSLPLM